MTFRDQLRNEPWTVDFFAAMREFERSAPDKPRIGDSVVLSEEIVSLGQDPFLEFPASNLAAYEDRPSRAPRVSARFLGFFGPQGALPLNVTVEARNWSAGHDPSFARFTDIFSSRFLQLFYRAWADTRPLVHHGRPREDRFFSYVGSFAGIGTAAFARRDTVQDILKIGFAGLVASSIKSASRLRSLVRGALDVDADVEEHVGTWLSFEPGDRMRLGAAGSTLGSDALVGGRSYSINDRVRIRIKARDLAQYRRFLPSGEMFDALTDLVFFYLGFRYEFEVQLALPARHAPPAQLGVSGELGWTAWVAPKPEGSEDAYFDDARFSPLERREAARAERKRQAAKSKRKPGERPKGGKA